jgi:hypothetical protein
MSQAKNTKKDAKSVAPKEVKPVKVKTVKAKGPKPDYTAKKPASIAATATKAAPNPTLISFGRHLNTLSFEVPLDFFVEQRRICLDAHRNDRPAAEAAYKLAVDACAEKVRVKAFDQAVVDLSRLLKTSDINLILPALRRSGLRYQGGKVEVKSEDHTWTSPPVFNEMAYVLVQKAMPKPGSMPVKVEKTPEPVTDPKELLKDFKIAA